MELVAVAAVAENGVIGAAGELPWPSVPDDKRQYRERVAGSPVVVGRVTYESMREDRPGDERIVLTSRPDDIDLESGDVASSSVGEAIEIARTRDTTRLYVLGGGEVYASFMPHFDRLLVSRIPGEYNGDTEFPPIDRGTWRKATTEPKEGYSIETWVRRDDEA